MDKIKLLAEIKILKKDRDSFEKEILRLKREYAKLQAQYDILKEDKGEITFEDDYDDEY